MGFSLRNFLEEATAQINPFDGGKTASTVRANRPSVKPAKTLKSPPKQSFFNKFVDIVDPNTEADQYRRMQQGRERYYVDSTKGLGAITKQIAKSLTETADTGLNLARYTTGLATGNREARDSAARQFRDSASKSLPGVIYKPAEDMAVNALYKYPKSLVESVSEAYGTGQQGSWLDKFGTISDRIAQNAREDGLTGSYVRDSAAPGLETGLNILSLGQAGFVGKEIAKQGLKKGVTTQLPSVGKTAGYNFAQGAGTELYNENPTLRGALERGAVNAGIGTIADVGLGVAGAGLAKSAKTTTNLIRKPAKIDIDIPDTRITQAPRGKQIVRDTNVLDAVLEHRNYLNGKGDRPSQISKNLETLRKLKTEKGVDLISGSFSDQKRKIAEFLELNGEAISNNSSKLDAINRLKSRLKMNETGAVGFDVRPDADLPNTKRLPVPEQKPVSQVQSPQNVSHEVEARLTQPASGTNRVQAIGQILESRSTLDNNTPIRVKQPNSQRQVPVRQMIQDGDTITATNVNSNIKAGEKRFSVTDTGELLEDRKGAYRIFTDSDGKVESFRIGNKVYNAKKELGDLSTVNEYGSTLATMRRNAERAFDKPTGEKVSKFLVDHQQAQTTKLIDRRIRLKNGMQEIADGLGINFKTNSKKAKKVSAAIQNYGEGTVKKQQLVDQFGQGMAKKIIDADTWFRKQYDGLLDEMNRTLAEFGHDPVQKRKNYYTHFQDPTLWERFGLKMQEIRDLGNPTLQDASPSRARGKISNKLAGESEFTQPNKRFNPFAQKREGDTYTPDAFKAFETYLNPTLNNIYMTPSIARARVISKVIAEEADMAGKNANAIIVQTKEWANRLAGKSNRFDRPLVDSKGGQAYLNAARWAQKQVGQNTIVGNLSTAVMQPIVLSQTTGKFGFKNTILATLQEMSTSHKPNAPIRKSEFMKRRYADVSNITDTPLDAARTLANKPLAVVEETAARITWQSAYNDAISKNMDEAAAIKHADINAEKTLAGRSLGERPELFESKAAGPFSMYQLEVNNYWQQVGKEMSKGQIARTMVAAYGLNMLLQAATNREVGFNPIQTAIEVYEETQKEGKDPLDKLKSVGQKVAGEFVDNMPIVAPLANATFGDKSLKQFLGNESNTGRFGVSSPISALFNNPEYAISPFGASQVKKTYSGIKSILNEGLEDKDGNKTVDVPNTAPNILRQLMFGPSATPEVSTYYDNLGRKKVDQTVVPNQSSSRASRMGVNGNEEVFTVNRNGQEINVKDLPLSERYLTYLDKGGQYSDLTDYNSAKNKIGQKVDKLYKKYGIDTIENNPYISKLYAQYDKKIQEGKIGEIERKSEERSLMRNIVKSQASEESRQLYGMSDSEIEQAINDGLVSQDMLNEAVAMDNYLTSKGLLTYSYLGKSLREKLGYDPVYAPGKTPKGRSGGRGGHRNTFGNYKLNKYDGADTSSIAASLRKLLEEAKF